MTITGTLEHIEGRKLVVNPLETGMEAATLYCRKGRESGEFLPLLASVVDIEVMEEKGYLMVEKVTPHLPKTEVENTKPVDMPPSANIPVLKFPSGNKTTADASVNAPFVQSGNRTQKDIDIMTQWSYGQATQATWASCNDALALSTEQVKTRIRSLAKWYRDEVLNRHG